MKHTITVEKRTSKAGKEYYVLVITWENGYKFETFLNNEQSFIIMNVCK